MHCIISVRHQPVVGLVAFLTRDALRKECTYLASQVVNHIKPVSCLMTVSQFFVSLLENFFGASCLFRVSFVSW